MNEEKIRCIRNLSHDEFEQYKKTLNEYKKDFSMNNNKTPLTEEELKEVELINAMTYDEVTEYFEKSMLNESNTDNIKPLGMSIEEFMEKYDCVDISSLIKSFGVTFPKQ
jgi:L-lysine 2,3-aminomutase